MLIVPIMSFGANDEFVVPFKDLIVTWIQGNVGLTIAIIIMIVSIIAGIAGGGFGVIGKGFILSIFIGAAVFLAEQSFNIGTSFSS
jgi:type IV secretory pathway VirB2 component (pilin)